MNLKSAIRRMLMLVTAHLFKCTTAGFRFAGMLPRPTAKSEVKSVLLSFPYSSVGDAVLAFTLLDHIHELWPTAAIDFAIGPTMAPVASASAFVRSVLVVKQGKLRNPFLREFCNAAEAIRAFRRSGIRKSYDVAIAARWEGTDSLVSAEVAYLSGAPIRCGYDSMQSGGTGAERFLLTHIAHGGFGEHESLRFLRTVGRCGIESASIIDQAAVERPIASLVNLAQERKKGAKAFKVPFDGPYAVLSPGATNPRRIWPLDRYAAIAKELCARFGLRIVVVGSKSDANACAALKDMIGNSAVNLAGQTTALELVDVLAAAAITVCNDSGPGHLSGALGTSTIVISPFPQSCREDHVNSPVRFKPVGPKVNVLQPQIALSPCDPACDMDLPHCIKQVTLEQVIESISQVVRIEPPETLEGLERGPDEVPAPNYTARQASIAASTRSAHGPGRFSA